MQQRQKGPEIVFELVVCIVARRGREVMDRLGGGGRE